MYDLTGFQRDLLYVAAGLDEPHGLAIKEELENYYEKEIHHGRLYPNLDTLEVETTAGIAGL
jgi:DNA-binding PadR family transcriptional regulator